MGQSFLRKYLFWLLLSFLITLIAFRLTKGLEISELDRSISFKDKIEEDNNCKPIEIIPSEIKYPPALSPGLPRRIDPCYSVPVEYPKDMKEKGVEGFVVIEFGISPEGIPYSLSPVEYTHEDFVMPALNAMAQFRYPPTIVDGKAVHIDYFKKFVFQSVNDASQ